MNQLYIRDGDLVELDNVSLQLATFSKFQPQTVDFLDISNPKAVYPTTTMFVYTHTYLSIYGHVLVCSSLAREVQVREQAAFICVSD